MFSMALYLQCLKMLHCVVSGQLFTKLQNSRLAQIQSPCRRQNNVTRKSKFEICFKKGRKHFGKREKMLVSLLSHGRKKSGLCWKRV